MFQPVLQLLLAAMVFAAPLADGEATIAGFNHHQQMGTGGGIIGFIILVLDIIVWSKQFPFQFLASGDKHEYGR